MKMLPWLSLYHRIFRIFAHSVKWNRLEEESQRLLIPQVWAGDALESPIRSFYKLTFKILFSGFGQAFHSLMSVTLTSLSFLLPNPTPQFQNTLLYNWTLAQTAYMPFLKDALSFPASTFFFSPVGLSPWNNSLPKIYLLNFYLQCLTQMLPSHTSLTTLGGRDLPFY